MRTALKFHAEFETYPSEFPAPKESTSGRRHVQNKTAVIFLERMDLS